MSGDPTRVKLEDASKLESKTDWKRVESLKDEDIRRSVEADPDDFLLDEN